MNEKMKPMFPPRFWLHLGAMPKVFSNTFTRSRKGGGFTGSLNVEALAERFNLRGRSSAGGAKSFSLERRDFAEKWERLVVKRESLRAAGGGQDELALRT
jgi:hypothetical protein